MGNAITEQDIYAALLDMFPEQYMSLRRIPKAYPHPGNEPRKAPAQHEKDICFSAEATASMSMQQLGELLSKVPTKSFTVNIEYVQTGTKEESSVVWDYDEDQNVEYVRQIPIYSDEVACITFRAKYEDPKWGERKLKAKADVRSWEDKMRTYKKNVVSVRAAEDHNKQLVIDARNKDREQWAYMGRHLKGQSDPEFLVKQRDKLLAQAARLDAMILTEK